MYVFFLKDVGGPVCYLIEPLTEILDYLLRRMLIKELLQCNTKDRHCNDICKYVSLYKYVCVYICISIYTYIFIFFQWGSLNMKKNTI